MISIAIVDDHSLMRDGIKSMLNQTELEVLSDFGSEKELKEADLSSIDVILMDINLKNSSGIELTQWLSDTHPKIKVIAITSLDEEINIIRMLKAGARAYFLKSSGKEELVRTITYVHKNGRYYSDIVSIAMAKTLNSDSFEKETELGLELSANELTYLRHLCSDKTNKEIAQAMSVSPRTSEGWSQRLCEKLSVKSRIGLAAFAIRNKLV